MDPLSNYISFLFFTTLLLPLQITARDSQFFSKVTHFNNNNNNKETTTELPNKEGPVTNTNKPEPQPAFIPETENSYGLYGHDSDPLPSTTTPTTTNAAPSTTGTTTYQTYRTQFEDNKKYPNNNKYYNNDAYNTKYYNKDAFGNNQNELSEAKYTEEEGYNSMENQNNNNNQKYYFNNNAANERFYSNNNNNNYNAANNRYNGERQGMSDTRFMEGGKYFYDVNYEKYNPALYGDSSSRGVNTNNNWYNNRGGNNNGNNNAYQNYGNYNGYQNQEKFEDEQEDFEP